jgi:hypothetical protein
MFNTIKPIRGNVIVCPLQKEAHKITNELGEEVEIFVDTSYSWDSRIKNNTHGILMTDYKNLKAGTHVIFNHNAISENNGLDIQYNGSTLHAIEEHLVYFGIHGEDIICLEGMMIAERIYDEDTLSPGGIILIEKKKQDSLLKILAKADNIEDFEIGDVAVVYKYSDYEIPHNIGGKIKKLIRLKYSDCLAKWEY